MATDIIARALALANAGGSDPSSGLFLGYVSENSSFPTSRSDGSSLQNEDYVKPSRNSNFPFEVGGLVFENRLTKAFYFNGQWELDPGLVQDTSETPVSNVIKESYSKLSGTQGKINEENVELFKEIKEALQPIATLETDRELVKSGQSTAVTIKVVTVKKGTNLKSVSILRNDVQIAERTGDDVKTGITFTYVDSISSNAKYKVRVIDIDNRIFYSDACDVFAVRPTYKGLLSDPSNFEELPLQKDANADVEYNFAYDGAVYKYPKEFGELTSILAVQNDQAYENYMDSFIKTEDGDYYVYSMTNKCRLINYKFKFIKQ